MYISLEWIAQRNKVLLSLDGVRDGALHRELEIAKVVDAVYYMANTRYVAPIAFFQNVLTYFLTGSKSSVKINSGNNSEYIYIILK